MALSCQLYQYEDGNQCTNYGGDCVGGDLITLGSRRTNNHCESCNAAYFESGNNCSTYSGDCDDGVMVTPVANRRQQNHCASCNAGFYKTDNNSCDELDCDTHEYVDGNQCTSYLGTCVNGNLMAEDDRRMNNHCNTCNDGYYRSAQTGLELVSTTANWDGALLGCQIGRASCRERV